METVILDEFVFTTAESENIFGHGFRRGLALQYYGGDTGWLIHWTPNYHRRLGTEKVFVDTTTSNNFCLYHNPLFNK